MPPPGPVTGYCVMGNWPVYATKQEARVAAAYNNYCCTDRDDCKYQYCDSTSDEDCCLEFPIEPNLNARLAAAADLVPRQGRGGHQL